MYSFILFYSKVLHKRQLGADQYIRGTEDNWRSICQNSEASWGANLIKCAFFSVLIFKSTDNFMFIMGGCNSAEYDDDYYYRDRRYVRPRTAGPGFVRRVPMGPNVVRGRPMMMPMGGGSTVYPSYGRPVMYNDFDDDFMDRRYRYSYNTYSR